MTTAAQPRRVRRAQRPDNVSTARTGDAFLDGIAPVKWMLLIYFALSLTYFLVGFLPDRQLLGSDHLAAGYFFNDFIAARLRAGALPKWVPYVYGGLPVYSNPGATFHPVRFLLSWVLPPERVLVAIFVIQFTLAGIGTDLFARALGARWWVAALGGLAYEFTGLTVSFVHAGHDGRIIAATMLPVILLCVTRAIATGKPLWFAALAASVSSILLSFQIQAAYYVLLAAGAWALLELLRARKAIGTATMARRAGAGLAAITVAFLLAAINFLPFQGYIKDSPRAATVGRGYEFSTQFSMPITETLGLAVPEQAGILENYKGDNPFKLHTEYVGAFVVLLVLLGPLMGKRDARWRFFYGLGIFALVMSWGGNTGFYHLYYDWLPGVSKFRSPAIGFFLVSFSLVMLATFGMEALARTRDEMLAARTTERPRVVRVLLGVIGVSLLLVVFGAAMGGPQGAGWARFGIMLLVTAALLRWLLSGRGNARLAVIALALSIVTDLWVVGRNFISTLPPSDQLMAADDVVDFLLKHSPRRVWVVPAPPGTGSGYLGNGTFGRKTDYLMHFGIRQMGGEHGNQLQRWNDYVGGTATMMADFHNLSENPPLVDAASTDYLVSTVQLAVVNAKDTSNTGHLREVFSNGRVLIYHNDAAMPRAYLSAVAHPVAAREAAMQGIKAQFWSPHDSTYVEAAPGDAFPALARTPLHGDAQLVDDRDPDRLVVKTTSDRDALLVLTEAYADGWVARVDGKATSIRPANYAFRSVVVPAGTHTVTFSFEPKPLYTGLRITLAALVVLLAWIAFGIWRERAPDERLVPVAA